MLEVGNAMQWHDGVALRREMVWPLVEICAVDLMQPECHVDLGQSSVISMRYTFVAACPAIRQQPERSYNESSAMTSNPWFGDRRAYARLDVTQLMQLFRCFDISAV